LKGKGFWRNRTKLYACDDFIDKFKEYWAFILRRINKRYTGSWWLEAKSYFKSFLIRLNKEQFTEENDEIKNLLIALERKKFLASLNPTSEILNENYYRSKKELAQKQINFIKNKIMHDKASDLCCGDTPTKAFFDKLRSKKDNSEPTELFTDDEVVEKNPMKIVHVAKEFFETKFKPRDFPWESNSNILGKFLNSLPVLDDNDLDVHDLMKPVTLKELEEVISTFKNGKAPGLDGLSIEFYKKTFGCIKHHLLNFINDTIFGEHLPRKISTGVIKLLFKKGDPRDLKNYRPITLMNVDLKIITKIFTLRLKPILPKIIHSDQYAQPGKQIADLNCLLRDILEEMENSDNDNFFIQFDFEKAFDSIDQNFLFKCLEKMNFPKSFIGFFEKVVQYIRFKSYGTWIHVKSF